MSRFLQLRELKTKQDDAISEYWRDLQGTVGVIREGFSNFLELPETTYLDNERNETPYVRIAKVVNGDYKYVMLHELPGKDGFLEFAIGLTLDRGVSTYPKQTIFTSLKLKKEEGGYLVTSSENNLTHRSSGSGLDADFSGLYESLFDILRKHLSYRP
ncbi:MULTISPECIES: hypothetical protein [Pseudomonas]|uniref:hypothetical protein n=1 Tax=Pseudomonas TaxID=286 RepID=UPI0037C6243E